MHVRAAMSKADAGNAMRGQAPLAGSPQASAAAALDSIF